MEFDHFKLILSPDAHIVYVFCKKKKFKQFYYSLLLEQFLDVIQPFYYNYFYL